MRKYDLYIFDFDYTLGDTTKAIAESINYGLVSLNHEPQPLEKIIPTIGITLHDAYFILTGVSPTPNEEKNADKFFGFFMEKADTCITESAELYEYTVPLLKKIKASGAKTAIVTTKAKYRIEEILERFGISFLIDVIVGSDIVTNPKPHPESVFAALSETGFSAENTVYIGDSVVDARAAAAGQVDFIGVLTGTTNRDILEKDNNINIFNDLGELYNEYLA